MYSCDVSKKLQIPTYSREHHDNITIVLQVVYKLIIMFTDLDDASADKVQAYLEK